MSARTKKTPDKISRASGSGRVLGPKAFAAITAVEGLKLSAAGKKRLKTSKWRKMSPAERRAAVVSAYSKVKGHK
jgi:hypothetical protein